MDYSSLRFGWWAEEESRRFAAVRQSLRPLLVQAPRSDRVPAEFVPEFLVNEDQGQTNTCCAHAKTTAGEVCHFIASRGRPTQFSRRAAYWWIKQADGSSPREDQGATIGSAARVGRETGFCPESLVPWYPSGRYEPGLPDEAGAKREAAKFVLGSVTELRNYAELDTFLSSGLGAVCFGIWWTSGIADLSGVEFCERDPGGQRLGGHAVCGAGWKTRGGERWPGLINSHRGWGNARQTVYFAPRVWDRWLSQSEFGAFGFSDMRVPEVRPLDWSEVAWGGGDNFLAG